MDAAEVDLGFAVDLGLGLELLGLDLGWAVLVEMEVGPSFSSSFSSSRQ